MSASRKRPLTDRQIKTLTRTSAVGGVPGLECVVSPGGARSWRLLFRIAGDARGRRRSLGLGRYPAVTLASARTRANEALSLAAEGLDPRTERQLKVARNDESFAGAVIDYLEWCRTNNARGTYDDKRSLLHTHALPVLGKLPLRSISRPVIAGLLDTLGASPARKRAAYAYLHHLFEWAIERGYADDNPCARLRAPKASAPRHRTLSDEEIAGLFQATGIFADIARLCLLTAQRRGSIEAMSWDDLDLARMTWTIPSRAMKSARAHIVPLSTLAVDTVGGQMRMKGPHVFGVGSNGARRYAGASNGMDGLRVQLFGKDWRKTRPGGWRIHDLRRTAVTLAQRGGCTLEEITALTQHRIPGVIGVYARHAYADEKRRVVEVIQTEIERVLNDNPLRGSAH